MKGAYLSAGNFSLYIKQYIEQQAAAWAKTVDVGFNLGSHSNEE